MNTQTTLQTPTLSRLFLYLIGSLVLFSCQQESVFLSTYQPYTNQAISKWQAFVSNEQLPVKERLQAWIKYVDNTSVYNNIYTDPPAEEKLELLKQIKHQILPTDHTSQILWQYLAGEYNWKIGNTKVAANCFETLEGMVDSLWTSYPNKRMIYHYLGILNGELGNPVVAINYTLKCIQECERVQDEHLLGITYWNTAIHYGNLEDFKEETEYLDKAMQLAEKLDYPYLKANILATKSSNYHDQEDIVRADSLYQVTLDLCDNADLEFVRYLTLLNYGNLMLHKGNYQQAYDIFKACKSYFQKIQNKFLLAAANSQLAALFITTDKLEDLASFIEQTVGQQERLGLRYERAESIRQLSFYHLKKRNYPQAFKYLQQYHELYEALNKSDYRTLMAQNILRHKEQEALNKQKLIQQLYLVLGLLSLCLFLAIRSYQIKRKANTKIQEQKRQLEQLNLTKERILSIIAHDLKKPMISFRGISQKVNYLLAKQDYSRLLALGQDIDKEVFSLNALVDNLLKWAMLQKNVLYNAPAEISLIPVVDQVFELFQTTARQKNITLSKSIDPSHQVMVDENVLQTILRNLVDNAIKFSPSNGTVHITSEVLQDGLQISVQDTGVGIPPEKLDQLFLLQKAKSTKGTYGEMGAGLGLHLVQELTKLCKGQIEVISQLGKGTSFQVYLPK